MPYTMEERLEKVEEIFDVLIDQETLTDTELVAVGTLGQSIAMFQAAGYRSNAEPQAEPTASSAEAAEDEEAEPPTQTLAPVAKSRGKVRHLAEAKKGNGQSTSLKAEPSKTSGTRKLR